VNDAIVKSELHEAGFSLVAESDLLRNPDDDHSLVVFNPAIRGKTDRYILKFQK
jgi:predicted methyltransferase